MQCAHPIDLDAVTPNAAYAVHSSRRRSAWRTIQNIRTLFTASVLLPAGLLAFGCYALLTLTGIGPQSWEARLCANGGLDLRSCQVTTGAAAATPAIAKASR